MLRPAGAQRPRPDSSRTKTDPTKLRPRATPAKVDSSKLKRAAPVVPPDTLKSRRDSAAAAQRPDTVKAGADSTREPIDTLRIRADSARADSVRSDSLNRENRRIIEAQRRRGDSIKAPTAAAEMPVLTDIGDAYRWTRDKLFASGALTLADLLEGIPGLTAFRSGWIGSPQTAAYLGDFAKVRVFYDGMEMDELDPRSGGVLELSFIQIWQLEEVRIERGAGEVRMYLRSWRVRSVTPSSRVDVTTGDLETNGYRGFFGRRFAHGEALQLGAYQLTSRDTRDLGELDGLSLFGRLGWAKGRFSVDGSFLRSKKNRTEQLRIKGRPNLDSLNATYADAYIRTAFTDPGTGLFVQLTASNRAFTSPRLDSAKLQTTISRRQYVGAVGWTKHDLSFSATARMRKIGDSSYVAPMVRASYDRPRFTLSVFGEQQKERALRRVEFAGRALPLSWLAVSGSVSRLSPTDAGATSTPTILAWRGELGVRLNRTWITAGLVSRDSARLVAPIIYDTGFRGAASRAIRGTFATVRGKIWKDVGLDITAMKWDSAGAFRPLYQVRSQAYVDSDMRKRYPSGNLHILFAVTHEYRTEALFPLATGAPLRSSQYRTLGFLLEIRLLTATLTYQYRNLLVEQYTELPGFQMPRPVQVYGVRWQFFN